jgi:hypothetical protein
MPSLHSITYAKTLLELALFAILVPLILWEVFKAPHTAGAKVLGQGATLP